MRRYNQISKASKGVESLCFGVALSIQQVKNCVFFYFAKVKHQERSKWIVESIKTAFVSLKHDAFVWVFQNCMDANNVKISK